LLDEIVRCLKFYDLLYIYIYIYRTNSFYKFEQSYILWILLNYKTYLFHQFNINNISKNLTCKRLFCSAKSISCNGTCTMALNWHPNFITRNTSLLCLQSVHTAAVASIIEFVTQKHWKALRISLWGFVAFDGRGQQQANVKYTLRKAITLSNVTFPSMFNNGNSS